MERYDWVSAAADPVICISLFYSREAGGSVPRSIFCASSFTTTVLLRSNTLFPSYSLSSAAMSMTQHRPFKLKTLRAHSHRSTDLCSRFARSFSHSFTRNSSSSTFSSNFTPLEEWLKATFLVCVGHHSLECLPHRTIDVSPHCTPSTDKFLHRTRGWTSIVARIQRFHKQPNVRSKVLI